MAFVAAIPTRTVGLPRKAEGVSVGMRRSADNDQNKVGRLAVQIYPDTAQKLGLKKGDKVVLLYGRGADAGKAMLRRATAADSYSLNLQAMGKGDSTPLSIASSALPRDPSFVGSRPLEEVKYQIEDGNLVFALPNWII